MDNKRILQRRLKKIEGQIRGLQKMIEFDRDCEEILTQFASINGALKSASLLLLKIYLNKCIVQSKNSNDTLEKDIEKILNIYISTLI
ncbi:MAG: metal-sensitive transcriptional regulator [Thermodesulfovibrionales bacterium]|nr:metal-sensitive transcriptional regulator [Thermodesulfovibrionales bacterium]